MSRYEIKQDGVLVNTIVASAEFVAEHFPSELYEVTFSPTAHMVRAERDALLVEVDAIASNVLQWSALDAPTQALWATYRSELLDVPQQVGFPHAVVWPTHP